MIYDDTGIIQNYISIKNSAVKHIKFFPFYMECDIPFIEVRLGYASSKYLSGNLDRILQEIKHLSCGTMEVINNDLIERGMFTIGLATLREECNAERVKAVIDLLILATRPFSETL